MTTHAHTTNAHAPGRSHYARFLIMILLSFGAMYVLMYAMVDNTDNAYNSLNQFYMAGMMTAAMVVIEMAIMFGMYHNKRLNAAILAAGAVGLVLCWLFTREQAAISDRQFLRSMIPHHGGAILMCEQAPIEDAEIKQLCRGIIAGQQAEIDQMKTKLRALSR